MAHHKSCIKRAKTSIKAREINRAYKSRLRTAIRRVLTSTEYDKAVVEHRTTVSLLDRLARKGVIHSNNAANKKSRLTRFLNQLGNKQTEQPAA
ncbi:30S ribosomal protein S20 [bacterium]|nr:30S ribosomal protein S20 [bacterium]